MQALQEDVAFLEHYGVKGMKWGVTRDISSAERKAGRRELKDTRKTARRIIKEARKSRTPQERRAAAKKYQDEVVARIKSPAWKKSYEDANTMGKGEMAVTSLTNGPFAALTIPALKAQYRRNQSLGADMELSVAKNILKEMRDV